ncbi:UbiD family decarboxylase [Chloroflexota bacterium]
MRDLREFLQKLEENKELLQINDAHWELEIGAITELVAKRDGPALLFDKIEGYPPGYRVASNLLNDKKRCAIALGMPPDTTNLEIIRRFRQSSSTELIRPIEVKTGPAMDNVFQGKDVNLLKFPTPRWHDLDGGRYIGTFHLVIMKDSDTGWVNAGVERVMLQDENTLSLYISPGKDNDVIREKYYSKGEKCPVVIAFSPDPILFMSGALALPWGTSELDWAGMIKQKPVEIIQGEITGIPFPANAEIVIEGECLLPGVETRPEGPFGEFTGYYARAETLTPVVHVKALYHRENPILAGCPPMKPPLVEVRPPVFTAPAIWDNLERAGVHGVQGVWQHEAGSGQCIVIVSIKQYHSGHSKKAALVAASGYLKKLVIVVDEDIDPTDIDEVLWAVAMRCDPLAQTDIIQNCWGTPLDPRLSPEQRDRGDYTHSTLIIDACKPFHWRDKFPAINEISPELKRQTIKKWGKKINILEQ